MPVSMRNIEREFSPSEAAAITGVSLDLQRDWRRRGFLPENKQGKWTRFSLSDIIQMSTMKTFTDAGFSVSYVSSFSSMSVLPTLEVIYEIPGAVVFEGDEVSDSIKELTIRHSVSGARGRYLVMIKSPRKEEPTIARLGNLDNLDEFMSERQVASCTILDCILLSQNIADKAGLPLMRVEVDASDNKKQAH